MPTELRQLLFRPAEVLQAVSDYYRGRGQALPAGTVVQCGPEAEAASGSIRFRITLVPDPARGSLTPTDGVRQEFVIGDAALAAALILHCRTLGIPLSAEAEKSLQISGEQLCLVASHRPQRDIPNNA